MIAKILIVIGLVCFVLATFGVSFQHIVLVPLGLAFVAASKLT